MRKLGIKRLQLLEVLSHGVNDDDIMSDSLPDDEAEDRAEEGVRDKRTLRPGTLERFATELTALATAGKLEPVIGREAEIERTIQVLSRRLKNNPIHVGDAGVGKTAITEGLAQRIAAGQCAS